MSLAEIENPVSGEVFECSLDSLAEALRTCQRMIADLREHERVIKDIVANLAPPPGDLLFVRSARLQTEASSFKITYPSVRWDRKTLLSIWERYPGLRDQYLAIRAIGVQLTPYKILVKSTIVGAPLKKFKRELDSARLPDSDFVGVELEVPREKKLKGFWEPNEEDVD